MDKIQFPYRAISHLPLLHVIAESGAWAKQGLDVDYSRKISSKDAHAAVARGDVEFVDGNHVSPYGQRPRGDDWIYVGQTVNRVPGRQLVVRAGSGIASIADLRGKKVGTRGHHPGLNDWLFLKQHGLDVDRDDVELVTEKDLARSEGTAHHEHDPDTIAIWEWVRDNRVDAAFITAPATVFAQRAGLTVIPIDDLPMIFLTTLSTGAKFVERHPDIVERFLKGTIEGIHAFQTRPEFALPIIRNRYVEEGPLDDEAALVVYKQIADALEPKLFPSPLAIANVYSEGVRDDKEALKVDPMALWDMHFLRRIDDQGFLEDLRRRDALAGAAR